MRKKVLALVLFVAMLLALIPGGTASAATFDASVNMNIPEWQVDGSGNTDMVIKVNAQNYLNPALLGNSTTAVAPATDASSGNYITSANNQLLARKAILGNTIYLPVDAAGKYDDTGAYVKGFTIASAPAVGVTPTEVTVYLDTLAGKIIHHDGSTTATDIITGLSAVGNNGGYYVYTPYATDAYTSITGSGTSLTVNGSWSTLDDDCSKWYGKPYSTLDGRLHYISAPVVLDFTAGTIGDCDIYVNGVSTGYKTTVLNGTTVNYVNANFLPEAGGNTATTTIEVYDRGSNYAYTTRTITLTYTDSSYSVTANSTLNAKVIGKTGNQAANFNVRLEGATFIVDVAAQTSDDITTLNTNALGGGAIDRSNATTTAANSTQKTNKDVNYLLQFKIQPLQADGTPYAYHTRIYPTAMKVYNSNTSFLIGSGNRYQQSSSSDPANHYYEVDSDGYITITLKLTQKDLVDGYIKTNNKLSSNNYGSSSVGSFSFTLGVTGSPKFTFDIVVNNVARSATTGTLSATELTLEAGASTTLDVTYAAGAFTTNTTFKAYSDGITVTADGNTATVTAGATAGTYFVIVTTADGNITIVPVVVTDPAAAVDETAGTYTITGRGVRIRTAPDTSTSKNIAKTTKKGDKVEVTSITDGWALLADGNYISAKYLTKD